MRRTPSNPDTEKVTVSNPFSQPPRLVVKVLKTKSVVLCFCQGSQSDDRSEEEDEVKNSAYSLEYVEQLPKPQIEHKRNDDQCPHEQCPMAILQFIILVVEDGKGGYHIGDDCRRSCANNHPGNDRYPSYDCVSAPT
jgi:hypothetical protein